MPWGWNHRRRDARWLDGTVVGGGGRHLRGDPGAPVPGRPNRRPPRPGALRPLRRPRRPLSAECCSHVTVVGSKAPTHAGVGMFARHAASTAEVELALHESLLPELGIRNIDAMPVAPTTHAYTSYVLAIGVPRQVRRRVRRGAAVLLDLRRGGRRARARLAESALPALDRHLRRRRVPDEVAEVWRSPTTSARPCPPPRRRGPGPISPPPPATSGCSGTRPGAARCGLSDAVYRVVANIRPKAGRTRRCPDRRQCYCIWSAAIHNAKGHRLIRARKARTVKARSCRAGLADRSLLWRPCAHPESQWVSAT